jgi:hypothetical protein
MTNVLAIDPGNIESGFVLFCSKKQEPVAFGKLQNGLILQRIAEYRDNRAMDVLVTEFLYARGMPASNESFQSQFWAGRFVQAWGGAWHPIDRAKVKLAICHASNAKDSNIRASLIERFGGEAIAIGGKKCPKCKGKGWFGKREIECPECRGRIWKHPPGPLYKMADDAWQALAIAITFLESS